MVCKKIKNNKINSTLIIMLQLWNIIFDRCLYTYNGHTKRVTHLAKNKLKNLFLSTSDDSTIRIWNMNSFPESESIHSFYLFIIVLFSLIEYLFKILKHVHHHPKLGKNIGRMFFVKILKDLLKIQMLTVFMCWNMIHLLFLHNFLQMID